MLSACSEIGVPQACNSESHMLNLCVLEAAVSSVELDIGVELLVGFVDLRSQEYPPLSFHPPLARVPTH